MICHEPASEVRLLLSLGNNSKHRVGGRKSLLSPGRNHRWYFSSNIFKDGQTVHLHPVLFFLNNSLQSNFNSPVPWFPGLARSPVNKCVPNADGLGMSSSVTSSHGSS